MEEDPCDICGGTHVGLCPDDPSEKEIFVTKTGRVLTDEEIEELADEAERGYDLSHLEKK